MRKSGPIKQDVYKRQEYLHSIGLLDRNVIAAHCVWLNPKEIELLARTGTSIGHCPKSNLKLASGVADIDTYLKAGITVALGTDGTASNNTLDLVCLLYTSRCV